MIYNVWAACRSCRCSCSLETGIDISSHHSWCTLTETTVVRANKGTDKLNIQERSLNKKYIEQTWSCRRLITEMIFLCLHYNDHSLHLFICPAVHLLTYMPPSSSSSSSTSDAAGRATGSEQRWMDGRQHLSTRLSPRNVSRAADGATQSTALSSLLLGDSGALFGERGGANFRLVLLKREWNRSPQLRLEEELDSENTWLCWICNQRTADLKAWSRHYLSIDFRYWDAT